jgi:hypothetical protein
MGSDGPQKGTELAFLRGARTQGSQQIQVLVNIAMILTGLKTTTGLQQQRQQDHCTFNRKSSATTA